jgi:hypothetical protein
VRRAPICFAFLAFTAQGIMAQAPVGGVPPAPVGHRQPTPSDLPPAVQKEEQPSALGNPEPRRVPAVSAGRPSYRLGRAARPRVAARSCSAATRKPA